jgi:pimeloyl-ACP methyl ester carboxylesterase
VITRGVLKSALAGVCLQALTVLASAPAPAADISQSQPVQAGDARVWFLRGFDPALSLDTATIYANGVAIGQSRPGAAFSVDLAPGTYTFTVPNDLPDGNQAPTVQLAAGAQVISTSQQTSGWAPAKWNRITAATTSMSGRYRRLWPERFLPALAEPPHG